MPTSIRRNACKRKSFASGHAPARPGRRFAWRAGRSGVAVVLAAVLAPTASAQVVPGEGAGIGTVAADRARLAQLRPIAPAPTARDSAARRAWNGWIVTGVTPTARFRWNSELPAGGNDAGLWAGRGANASLTGGLRLRRTDSARTIEVVLAPTLLYSQNTPFAVEPGRAPGRSAFSSPWHLGTASADLPLRFGDLPIRSLGLGQSAVTVGLRQVDVGLSTTNEWWGPAIRHTLVLGNNAAGVPRAFVRTARPLHTRAGAIEGRLILGALTESPFFDTDPGNDTRSLSGLLVTLRPALDTLLTIGLARVVIAPVGGVGALPVHALDVLTRFAPLAAPDDTTDEGGSRQRTDQLTSLFARWRFPASGVEAYGELARLELPRSLRALLDEPRSTQGYTLGLQWADPRRARDFLRLQAEVTYLEQTRVVPDRVTPDFYTGAAAPQGFTQRGQVLGAAVGPGGSEQFLALDWMAASWQGGVFAGRTRTEEDALYRQLEPSTIRHDVTVFGGVRGAARLPHADLAGEATWGRRIDYLFQNIGVFGAPHAVDVRNLTVTFTLSPR